jgi:hypothetical protein
VPLIDSLTVGVFLKSLFDQLDRAIESARNAGLALEIQAAEKLTLGSRMR